MVHPAKDGTPPSAKDSTPVVRMASPKDDPFSPCEQNESQTGVKTLPCPKLLFAGDQNTINVITDLTFRVVYFFTKLGPELTLPVWAGKM